MLTRTRKSKAVCNEHGIALVVVLVLLTVLCVLAYTLTLRVSAYRKRTQYMIDYQAARYACDSAVKYALAALQDINEPVIISRPNEPDFSDLFALDEQQYRELLTDWWQSITAEQAAAYQKKVKEYLRTIDINDFNAVNDFNGISDLNVVGDFNAVSDLNAVGDSNDINALMGLRGFAGALADANRIADLNDPNNLQIPGPYGPPWPLVAEPLDMMVGDARVTIEIHDENAKYPIGWMMLSDQQLQPQIRSGFETFCEWMDVNSLTVSQLEDELAELDKIKQYKLKFDDITMTQSQRVAVPSRTARTRRLRRSQTRVQTTTTTIPAAVNLTDFARLFHSPLLNTEALARPVIVADDRTESALKYISLWPISTVNVNTAPRHVLEAAFAFGGLSAAVEVADGVIQKRRIKPFDDPNEIRRELFRYGDSIEKCRQYIVTKSDLFTIRVTARQGLARASAVIAVRNNHGKLEKIAVLSG